MIKKFFLFKEAIGTSNTKLQKLVDEANNLLTQIYDKLGEGANIEDENMAYQVNPITYINGVITIEYGTGYNYKKDREREIYSLEYDSEKEIISSLKNWIKLFKKNVFNNSQEGKAKFCNKIKDLVEQLNILIKIGYDKHGYKIGIYDTQSTWQEEEKYEPLEYNDGKSLIIKYSKTTNKNQIKEYDLQNSSTSDFEEIISDLEYLIKQYRKFVKKEGIYPLTQKDVSILGKLIELLDNESNKMFKKVKLLGVDPFFVNNVPYKEVLDEELNRYNIIPGVYMIHGHPDKENIKIYISYYNQVYIVHEQYLSRIYKLYKRIKN
jgi:hypothetical protein